MRDHRHHIRKDRNQAVQDLLARCSFQRDAETVSVYEAAGRVLAEPLAARHTLPNKPTSKMDAIAVHFDDFAEGTPDVTGWQRGRDFQFCNTGVAMPEGFDTAIAIERVTVTEDGDGLLAVDGAPSHRGQGVSLPGSVVSAGTPLVEADTLLKPAHASLLAQGGYREVPVVRRPRVAFIPTGNELVEICEEPPAGKNIESNSVNLCGKLSQWGAEPLRHAIVKDNWEALREALEEACESADIVVINAGSSKGSDDFTCEILDTYGEVLSHETDMAPGKHASCSLLHGTPVIGISGPPGAADLNAAMFVKPVVDAFLYGAPQPVPTVRARLAEAVPKPKMDRMNVAKRVKLTRAADGTVEARILPLDAPALRDCAEADGLLIIPRGADGWEAGEEVPIELLWPYVVSW